MNEVNLGSSLGAINELTSAVREMSSAFSKFAKNSGLKQIADDSKKVTRNFQAGIKKTGEFANAISGLGREIFDMVKSSAAMAGEISKTAKELGIGVVALQRLQHHAKLSGVSTDQLKGVLSSLGSAAAASAKKTGDAKDVFDELGISVEDGSGKIKDSETLMAEVADALEKVEDKSRRAALAQELLGSSGAAMIALSKGGRDAMKANGDEAERLGVVTEEQVRASKEFNDNLIRFQRVANNVGHVIARVLLPHINTFATYLLGLVDASDGSTIAIAALATAAVKFLFSALSGFVKFDKVLGKIGSALKGVAVAGLKYLGAGLKFAWPLLVKIVAATAAWTVALLANPLTWIILGIAAAVAAVAGAAYLVYRYWDDIVAFVEKSWTELKALFNTSFLGTFVEDLKKYFKEIDLKASGAAWLKSIKDGIDAGWGEFTSWFDNLIEDAQPDWFKELLAKFSLQSDASFGSPMQSALGGRADQVNGQISVSFDNLPNNARVESAFANTAGFIWNVNAGYSMEPVA